MSPGLISIRELGQVKIKFVRILVLGQLRQMNSNLLTRLFPYSGLQDPTGSGPIHLTSCLSISLLHLAAATPAALPNLTHANLTPISGSLPGMPFLRIFIGLFLTSFTSLLPCPSVRPFLSAQCICSAKSSIPFPYLFSSIAFVII